MRVVALVVLLIVGWVPLAEGARVLRAKDAATGQWLQRVDSGTKSEAAFQADVAAQFGLPVGQVQVVVTEWTETQRQQAVVDLAAGTHEGLAVIAAPLPAAVADPDAMRKSLGGIFAGTPAQKRVRWGDILQAHPWVATVLTLLRTPMTVDATATVTELLTRVCQRVGGGASEVLTATEYDALKTLADGKNLGALVPARPCP